MITSPMDSGSIVYDFSVASELWIAVAQALVKASATYDTVDQSDQPLVVKYGHFSYYPLQSSRYIQHHLNVKGVEWPVVGLVFNEGIEYKLEYMFKAYSLDQNVPTTLTVQFLCKAKTDGSSISVATKVLNFIG